MTTVEEIESAVPHGNSTTRTQAAVTEIITSIFTLPSGVLAPTTTNNSVITVTLTDQTLIIPTEWMFSLEISSTSSSAPSESSSSSSVLVSDAPFANKTASALHDGSNGRLGGARETTTIEQQATPQFKLKGYAGGHAQATTLATETRR
jgi:hypothetical protein